MAGMQSNVFVGLDLGTSGIAVAVFNADFDAGWELLGVGYSPALGVDQGIVNRADEAAAAIKRAVKEAELTAGVRINGVSAAVNVPGMIVGGAMTGLKLKAGQRITQRDLNLLRRDLGATVLPVDFSIIQLLEVLYYLDGEPITGPLGSKGRIIKLEALVLAAPGGFMEALQDCLSQAGLKTKQTIAGPLAMAEAVLTGVERELGVVCVDMGAGLTKVAYINRGRLEQMKIFPAGSGHITSDLAVGLHIALQVAETMKIKYGLGHIEDYIEASAFSGQGKQTFPGPMFNQIIRSRLEEILDFVKQFTHALRLTASPLGGVVITGGGARLTGLQKFAENYLAMPVRVGTCRVSPEAVPEEEAYRYISAIGLGLWGFRQESQARRVGRQAKRGILGRIKNWL